MGIIISILLILLVAIVIYYIVQNMLPVDARLKQTIYIVISILTIIAILYQAAPLFPALP